MSSALTVWLRVCRESVHSEPLCITPNLHMAVSCREAPEAGDLRGSLDGQLPTCQCSTLWTVGTCTPLCSKVHSE